MTALSRLKHCERGASVIEFALAAPFLAALLVAMIDVSRAYSDRLLLEQAAQRTIEKVEQQHSVSTNYSNLETEAETAAGTGSNATIDYWLECSSDGTTWTRASSFTGACASNERYARYVSVTITKTFVPMLGTRFAWSNSNGSYTLTAEAGIRVQ